LTQIRHCLQATADSGVLRDCLQGRSGETARDVVREDCSRLLSAAERSLEQVDVELTGSDEDWKNLIITGGPAWSAYDQALMHAIGDGLCEGRFLDEVFRLIAHTEERCRLLLAEKATDGLVGLVDSNHLFAALYVWRALDARPFFPGSTIYHASRFHFA